MPVVYPQVPGDEHSVRQRIVKKYLEYMRVYGSPNPDPVTLQGERYEIAAAILIYRKNLLTDGDQIGRWHTGAVAQNVSVGANTEYDFAIPASNAINGMPVVAGPILGEAKSYTNGLGPYIKKAIGYCLNDPTIGGFCFVTPGNDYQLFMQMLYAAISIMGGLDGAPGVTGGEAWKAAARAPKPGGQAIRTYYQQQYYANNTYPAPNNNNYLQVLQNDHAGDVVGFQKTVFNPHTGQQQAAPFQLSGNRRSTADYFNAEMAFRAGFVIACYRLPNVNHDELRNLMGSLT